MTGYITGFSVYTLAMIGVIFVGLVIVKKCLSFSPNRKNNSYLKVEYCLNLEPRKNLYVVKAGREKFLISSSGENCNFMTKLESSNFSINTHHKHEYIEEEKLLTDIQEAKSSKRYENKYSTGVF